MPLWVSDFRESLAEPCPAEIAQKHESPVGGRRDVLRFVPERIDEFNTLMEQALERPAFLVRRAGR